MPRKRTGSLVELKTGFFGRYWADLGDGYKHQFVNLHTENEIIARRKLDALVEAAELGHVVPEVETFAQAAARVLEQRKRLGISSWRGEVSYMDNHVLPTLGRMPATKITKRDVLSVLEKARDAGLAGQTIVHIRNAVSAVFKQLRREGVLDALPVPATDELPESLPESVDDRAKAILSERELLLYASYTDPRKAEMYRGAVRERQMMVLLSLCGGLRSSELHGLDFGRVQAESGSFDAIEVIRYKTRRKASTKGSKAVARQRYELGKTVMPLFLRYWHLRRAKVSGRAPTCDDLLFPVRRAPSSGAGERVGEKRGNSTWASALRRDVQRAFEAASAAGEPGVPVPGSRRWVDLFDKDGGERQRLIMHSSRNMAAIAAEKFERLEAAAKFTGHASGHMVQHYRSRAGEEIHVVDVRPELLPDAAALVTVLRSWCAAEGISFALVSGVPDDDDGERANGSCKPSDSSSAEVDGLNASPSKTAAILPFTEASQQIRKRLLYPSELWGPERASYCNASTSSTDRSPLTAALQQHAELVRTTQCRAARD
ncbi:MAG: hypothetical protein RLZZ450_2623 [Pseudomonadota bacterium]|jgi:integrase